MWNRRKVNTMDIFEEMNDIIEFLFESGFDPETMDEPVVWGFSMIQRGDEIPEILEFGNIKCKDFMGCKAEHQSCMNTKPHVKKPVIDIMKNKDTLHVVVEMPGVTKKDIDLDCTDTMLDIKANSEDRKYCEHIELSVKVLPDSAKATYKNGVLEVIFKYDNSDKKSDKTSITLD